MFIHVESEHLVRRLDHTLHYRHFERVACVSTDTSLAKTGQDRGLPTITMVDHLIVYKLLLGIVLH